MQANWIQKADLWLLYSGFPQDIYIYSIYRSNPINQRYITEHD